jgi:hypothetical protein
LDGRTWFFAQEEAAMTAFADMKRDFELILSRIPDGDDALSDKKKDAVSDAIGEFSERY